MDECFQVEVALISHAEVGPVLFPEGVGRVGTLEGDFPGLHGLVGLFRRLGWVFVRLWALTGRLGLLLRARVCFFVGALLHGFVGNDGFRCWSGV